MIREMRPRLPRRTSGQTVEQGKRSLRKVKHGATRPEAVAWVKDGSASREIPEGTLRSRGLQPTVKGNV